MSIYYLWHQLVNSYFNILDPDNTFFKVLIAIVFIQVIVSAL